MLLGYVMSQIFCQYYIIIIIIIIIISRYHFYVGYLQLYT